MGPCSITSRWFDGSVGTGSGADFGGVGIGTADRTVGLYTAGAVDQTTLAPRSGFPLANSASDLVGLPCSVWEAGTDSRGEMSVGVRIVLFVCVREVRSDPEET